MVNLLVTQDISQKMSVIEENQTRLREIIGLTWSEAVHLPTKQLNNRLTLTTLHVSKGKKASWGKSLFPVAPSSLMVRSACGCNSSQNRPLRLLNCNSDHDGVFIVHYVTLIWDSCCVGKHMTAFATIFGAINQWPCWISGFQTVPSVNQHTVFFLTSSGSCLIWQKDASRHRDRRPELYPPSSPL